MHLLDSEDKYLLLTWSPKIQPTYVKVQEKFLSLSLSNILRFLLKKQWKHFISLSLLED